MRSSPAWINQASSDYCGSTAILAAKLDIPLFKVLLSCEEYDELGSFILHYVSLRSAMEHVNGVGDFIHKMKSVEMKTGGTLWAATPWLKEVHFRFMMPSQLLSKDDRNTKKRTFRFSQVQVQSTIDHRLERIILTCRLISGVSVIISSYWLSACFWSNTAHLP